MTLIYLHMAVDAKRCYVLRSTDNVHIYDDHTVFLRLTDKIHFHIVAETFGAANKGKSEYITPVHEECAPIC
jgi:hypothetical protein